ncbi:COG1020: Non-ribosomal peptide synthetase modules and related proteins [Corynebacterium casei]|uniref:condensation domain-containing protein n=1 Tax=Corynebacterium casei TaxID=160386 RepID=UPI0009C6CB1B|nr:condensation domain-containing protein [Corynebacterium casei]SLM93120.1 COG1020: Non-ribosomal peptide synthetase modules and related proteins [Corynebacterium casei]
MSDFSFNGRQKDLVATQLMRQDAALNLNGLYSFPVPPNETILREAIKYVGQYYKSLSYKVAYADGQIYPEQVQEDVRIACIEGLSMREQFDAIYELARHPFDLLSERPFRVFLFRTNQHVDQMLLQFHHVATDWWSFRVIHKALTEYYDQTEIPTLSKDNIFDYNSMSLLREDSDEALAFWEEQLRPGLVRRVKQQGQPAVHQQWVVSSDLQKIEAIAREWKTTLFEALFLKFAQELMEVFQQDFLINTPVGNRKSAHFVSTVGYVMNVVPVRCHYISGHLNWERTLKDLRLAIKYGETSRGKLSDIARLSIGTNEPLFDIVFMFLRDNIGAAHMPANSVFTRIYPGQDEDSFVLTLREQNGVLTAVVESQGEDVDVSNAVISFLSAIGQG